MRPWGKELPDVLSSFKHPSSSFSGKASKTQSRHGTQSLQWIQDYNNRNNRTESWNRELKTLPILVVKGKFFPLRYESSLIFYSDKRGRKDGHLLTQTKWKRSQLQLGFLMVRVASGGIFCSGKPCGSVVALTYITPTPVMSSAGLLKKWVFQTEETSWNFERKTTLHFGAEKWLLNYHLHL